METPLVQAKIRGPTARGLVRPRLLEVLAEAWDHRITLLVAPAGSGKTTVLAQFAGNLTIPAAWYHAEAEDAVPERVLAYVGAALRATYTDIGPDWRTAAEGSASLDIHATGPVLLVIDDFHTLAGTAAERELIRLADYAPTSFHLLLASRAQPSVDLTRHRLNDVMKEIGADALRFRSWEVETLFREVYATPMPPDLLADLSRRSDGWAAALQLFHLACRGKSLDGCRRLVASLGRESRLMTEYLARNVLGDLPSDVAEFMLYTCVLHRLTGALCDELLGRTGSIEVLRTLERASLFTVSLDGQETFRYHEVLRSHLEGLLVEHEGEEPVRLRFAAAAELLERHRYPSDALLGYCRAERWDDVARLLRSQGELVAEDRSLTIQALPRSVRDFDPWLLLAGARRSLASGHLADAEVGYRAAESVFGKSSGGDIARRERLKLAAWLDPEPNAGHQWAGLLRQAVRRDPATWATAASAVPGPGGRLTSGLAKFLAGQIGEARQELEAVAEDAAAPPPAAMAARLGALVAGSLSAPPVPAGASMHLAEECEALSLPWLARLARATGRPEAAETAQALADFAREGDHLGAALATVVAALVGLCSGAPRPVDEVRRAADRLDELGLPVVASWAWSLQAVALAGGDDAGIEAAKRAEAVARSVGAQGPLALAWWALGHSGDERAGEARIAAESWESDAGAVLPPVELRRPALAPSRAHALVIRCFGPFRIERDGEPLDLSSLKPRARSLLRLLAANANRPVHREQLIEALWPEGDPAAGARNLQVALSSIRSLLEPDESRGGRSLVARSGDSYSLTVPPGGEVDHVRFTQVMHDARAAGHDDQEGAADLFAAALELYADEFLPEDGPAEWAVKARDRYRLEAADAAECLARLVLREGRPTEAAAACERGLGIDGYRDSLWRLLVEAHLAARNFAAGKRARQQYVAMLSELGFDADSADLTSLSMARAVPEVR